MRVKESDSNKRNNERINLSFLISIPGQDGKIKNISTSGVYFEIITSDIEAFAPRHNDTNSNNSNHYNSWL